MATVKGKPTERIPPHRVLREVYRHYLEFRDIVTSPSANVNDEGKSMGSVFCDNGIIEYGYFVYNDDGSVKGKECISLSFWDLHGALQTLSKRKREAVFYNVILDWKQRDVAKRMGITTVSVGQYVETAMLQLAERYFAGEFTT